jgi:hypothetical protein
MCSVISDLTFGDFYAISYFLKLFRIESTSTFNRLIKTSLSHGYNQNEYSRSENKAIKKLFEIILYSEITRVEDQIRAENDKLKQNIFKKHLKNKSKQSKFRRQTTQPT